MIISGILSALAAVCSFIPYLAIYFVIRELILVFPDMPAADMTTILMYGWFALAGIAGNVVLYFCALMCSHLAAFGTLYELKLNFANHITAIPLGYHLTIGSGRMRKIMDENIESIEKFMVLPLCLELCWPLPFNFWGLMGMPKRRCIIFSPHRKI